MTAGYRSKAGAGAEILSGIDVMRQPDLLGCWTMADREVDDDDEAGGVVARERSSDL